MKPVISIAQKAVRLGPLPYLALGAAIVALGAVMQMRAGAVVVGNGGTVFGLFAQVGGAVGLFGLLISTVRITPDDDDRMPDADHAASKREAQRSEPAADAPPSTTSVSPRFATC